eukprot:g22031.t1
MQPKEDEEPMEQEQEDIAPSDSESPGEARAPAKPECSEPPDPPVTSSECSRDKGLHPEDEAVGAVFQSHEVPAESAREGDQLVTTVRQKPVEMFPPPLEKIHGAPSGDRDSSPIDAELPPSPAAGEAEPGKDLQAELVIKMQAGDPGSLKEPKNVSIRSPGHEARIPGGQNHQLEAEEFPKPCSVGLTMGSPKPEVEADEQARSVGVTDVQQLEQSAKSLLDSSGG